MAKDKAPSLDDFNEENLLEVKETEEIETTDSGKEDEKEEIVEKVEKKDKKKVQPKKEKPAPVLEETEEEKEETEEVETKDELETETKEDEDQDVDPVKFFEEVTKITGQEVEVEYGEIDPLTPQGIALREKAIQEATLGSVLAEMEENYPQVYRALQHARNGGDVSELFSQSLGRDYSKVEISDTDENLAKEILKEYYKSKGVKNDSKIAKLVATAEDSDEGIVGEAKSALEELRAEQENKVKAVEERSKKDAAERTRRDQAMVSAIDDVIENKKLGSFRITDRQDASQFREFVLQNVSRAADGKYNLITSLDPSNLEQQLQFYYFQFKKGDLSKIIQQKAETVNAQRLKLRLAGDQEKTKKQTMKEEKQKGSASMKEYEV